MRGGTRQGNGSGADNYVAIEDGWAAREHLITANSRLVISVAKNAWDGVLLGSPGNNVES
jgi:hypothetical protein